MWVSILYLIKSNTNVTPQKGCTFYNLIHSWVGYNLPVTSYRGLLWIFKLMKFVQSIQNSLHKHWVFTYLFGDGIVNFSQLNKNRKKINFKNNLKIGQFDIIWNSQCYSAIDSHLIRKNLCTRILMLSSLIITNNWVKIFHINCLIRPNKLFGLECQNQMTWHWIGKRILMNKES